MTELEYDQMAVIIAGCLSYQNWNSNERVGVACTAYALSELWHKQDSSFNQFSWLAKALGDHLAMIATIAKIEALMSELMSDPVVDSEVDGAF